MKISKTKKVEVFEAKSEHNTGYFYCKQLNKIGKVNGNCNAKKCLLYSPRNKKSGICKYHKLPMSEVKKVVIKIR